MASSSVSARACAGQNGAAAHTVTLRHAVFSILQRRYVAGGIVAAVVGAHETEALVAVSSLHHFSRHGDALEETAQGSRTQEARSTKLDTTDATIRDGETKQVTDEP